ncbi:MAG: sigma-70 family RNA polymerase sigma factor [Pontiellaceae bacterium]|nr:sigma-70 family RNA polymerase sigma factor [Pontiellaceae bacterium]
MKTNNQNDDQVLLRAIRKEKSSGWEQLFTQYDPLIQSIVRWSKWHFSDDEQKDVSQNIHMQLYKSLKSFQQKSSLSKFIKSIAIHHCINEVRRKNRWSSIMTSFPPQTEMGEYYESESIGLNASDPYTDIVKSERIRFLNETLKKLHKTCQTSIHLFYMKHFSYKQISDALGISTNTVGSRMSKCLDKLRSELRKDALLEGNP